MPSQRVVWLYSTLGSLVKEAKNKNQANKRFSHRHVPEVDPAIGDAIFGHGRLMTAIATFQQGHMRLVDRLYESPHLRSPAVKQYLQDIAYAEEFWNSIAEVTLPDLTCVGKQAIAAKDDLDRTISRTTTPWPSIYVGIDVIVNQETPPHLDTISTPSLLDLVVSLGTHDSHFHISDLGIIFAYLPGTMIYLAGKFLHHSVPKREKGERIALAHYMKDMVHSRFGVWRPAFTQQKDILGKFLWG
ncbi:hypothetical protein EDC04DRAFT_2912708 [Pisolithus marmoratus]|nr:hypothetical protein EDC04DRAFT_2912708 [Pisolithus marmoratus]